MERTVLVWSWWERGNSALQVGFLETLFSWVIPDVPGLIPLAGRLGESLVTDGSSRVGVLIQRSGSGELVAQLPSVLQRSLGVQASELVMVGCRASRRLGMPLRGFANPGEWCSKSRGAGLRVSGKEQRGWLWWGDLWCVFHVPQLL